MKYVTFDTEKGKFVLIGFPENYIVEGFCHDIIYKEQGQLSYKSLPKLKDGGILRLISKFSELDANQFNFHISTLKSCKLSNEEYLKSLIENTEICGSSSEIYLFEILNYPEKVGYC